jgi:MYXO-CTERM domain-containing protein
MNRALALCLLAALPASAYAQEFSSEPALLTFEARHPVVDQNYVFPVGLDLDLIFAQYWVGVELSLEGLATFGLVMEGESNIYWDTRDGNDGVVYQKIEPLTGANSIGVMGEANFLVSFDIREGSSQGNPLISIGLLSESAIFDVATEDFVPFLLPGQEPSYETVTSNSTDASIRLPFNLDILDVGILAIGAGFEIVGYPTVTATITGESLSTAHESDIFELDGDLRPTPISLYEQKPELSLMTAYSAYIQSFMGYVVNADMSFNIDIFGSTVVPINIPLFDQTFQLFSGADNVDFPTLEYTHPLPVATVPIPAIDFGDVAVDTFETFVVPFNNDGSMRLVGLVGMTGDTSFSAAPVQLDADPGGQDAVVVTFAPTEKGEYSGVLFFETSDPVVPYIEIPISATASTPQVENPFGDDNGDIYDGGGSTLYSTCGCAASRGAPAQLWPAFGLLGLLGLRRRRT